ncbi:MAG: glyoxalase superfamily protein [Pseudomonadota bacterium]
MKHLYTRLDLKSRAAALRVDDETLTQTRAYELLAKQLGYRNWNTLHAAAADWSICQRVHGHYLGHPFSASILGVQQHAAYIALILRFDDPIDVVASEHFSNVREKVTVRMQSKTRSVGETSNGVPHLILR